MTAPVQVGPSPVGGGPAGHRFPHLTTHPTQPKTVVTRRQVQILKLAANGNTNRAIGSWLGISEETVKSQLKTADLKLRVADRTQAVAVAMAMGLLSLADIDIPAGIVPPAAHRLARH